jgi:hypothetical protein
MLSQSVSFARGATTCAAASLAAELHETSAVEGTTWIGQGSATVGITGRFSRGISSASFLSALGGGNLQAEKAHVSCRLRTNRREGPGRDRRRVRDDQNAQEIQPMVTALCDADEMAAWAGGPISTSSRAGWDPSSANRSALAELREGGWKSVRVPYALRRVTLPAAVRVIPLATAPTAGDIALARLEKVGRNARLELANGRPCSLHAGDLLAVVFGNRYATMQFEGYARTRGDSCDLLSMGGLCGVVQSKHDAVAESTKLKLLGALADADGRALRLADHALPRADAAKRTANVVVVCGTSMDAGKTYTATSLIQGLREAGAVVAGIKLTGTAAGRDTWGMLDAGACVALDFVDGGFPSTYLATLEDLLTLEAQLAAYASARGAQWIVMEIADGLLQSETSALLRCEAFTRRICAWVFAAGDAMSASAGVRLLREWNLDPIAISGRVTMSPLAMQEAESATGVPCYTAGALQGGALASRLMATFPTASAFRSEADGLAGGRSAADTTP